MLLPLSREPELSPNRRALPLVREMIERRLHLRLDVIKTGGATVLDCGARTEGGLETGLMFSKVCLGGLAEAAIRWHDFRGLNLPAIEVTTDHPIRACMASQYAGWPIKCGGRMYMGSGPACSVVHRGSLFRTLGYEDDAETVILCLECPRLPSEEVIELVTASCGCKAENLYILVAPTTSQTGAVQVAARALETALFKLRRLGYDLGRVVSGTAVCPISPVARDTKSGLGRTNDAISYGSTVQLYVRDEDDEVRSIARQVPSSASAEYGVSYVDIEKTHDNFFNLSPDQFNPAVISMNNLSSGNTIVSGEIRPDILRRSFGMEN